MDQIYDFEKKQPPALAAKMLRAELQRRQLKRQTAVVAIAAILANICLFLTAVFISPFSMAASVACLVYACLSMTGGSIIAILLVKNRRGLRI